MAYSTQRAVSDGTMTYIDVSIGYQYQSDIAVYYNDLPAGAGTWAWSSTTSKRIVFTNPIAAGVEVMLKRTSTLDKVINVFASGAKFNNASMDTNFSQMLYLTQEAVEGAALTDIFNDVDFHAYKIKNLGPAVDDNDAITYGQVKTLSNGAYTSAQGAAASAAAASTSAAAADSSAANSATSAAEAATSASAASGSANTASTQATAAQGSATSAAASAARAESAAAPATDLINQVNAANSKSDAAVSTASSAQATASAAMPKAGGDFSARPTVNGKPVWDKGNFIDKQGHCYFSLTSAGVARLDRFNGTTMLVNGNLCTIPSGGLTLSATGTSVNTMYYVYAVSSDGANVTGLEYSTTGYSIDVTYGTPVRADDGSRSLVGKLFTSTAGAWSTGIVLNCLSWYNRRRCTLEKGFSGDTSDTSPREYGGTYALSWANELVEVDCSGYCGPRTSTIGTQFSQLYIDGAGAGVVQRAVAAGSSYALPLSLCIKRAQTDEGLHKYSFYGWVDSNTLGHVVNAVLYVTTMG